MSAKPAASTRSLFGTIRARLTFGSLALAIVPLLVGGIAILVLADRQATQSLTERAIEQLNVTATVKRDEVVAYFDETANLLRVLASAPGVTRAMLEMPAAQRELPTAVTADAATQRQALKAYWGGDFIRQYKVRNGDKTIEMASLVDTLPADTLAMQYQYIAANPNPLGKKMDLANATDGSRYAELHAEMQRFVKEIYARYGFYDVFLVEPDTGRVVYTYFKELDFATSLVDGPWAQTGLAEAFMKARDATAAGSVFMTDFAPYVPSYNDQAAFVSTPIFFAGQRIGVLIVQLPIDRLNKLMTFDGKWEAAGLGKSGEAYLIGPDFRSRSASRFLVEDKPAFVQLLRSLDAQKAIADEVDLRGSNIGLTQVKTQATNDALGGKAGTGIFADYRGIPVLGSYAPIEVLGNKWAMTAEIDEAEALAPVATLRRNVLLTAAGAIAVLLLFSFFTARKLVRSINAPIAKLKGTVDQLAAGNMDARAKLGTSDELGELADALDRLLDDRVATMAKAERENEVLNGSVVQIMQGVMQLARRDLTVKVPVSADVTGAISDAINMMSSETATTLRQVHSISNEVASVSDKVRSRSDGVEQVAQKSGGQAEAASSELANAAQALRTIAQQANRATLSAERAIVATNESLKVVNETGTSISGARDQIRETEKRVKRLGERSQEIASVVGIINQIAERTSVLALNASMQAVAAGDAGRGFAVVADEVKRLAENARQATQQISSLVNAIQADTVETVQAVNNTIGKVVDISKLAELAGSQMATTRDATQDLVTSVHEIAVTTDSQARASDVLIQRARQLVDANRMTLEELGEQKSETDNLVQAANRLIKTVSVFQLPG